MTTGTPEWRAVAHDDLIGGITVEHAWLRADTRTMRSWEPAAVHEHCPRHDEMAISNVIP